MSEVDQPRRRYSHRVRRAQSRQASCPMCHEQREFFWTCPCGFLICDECMKQELWGFTCNNLTWVCPDCGEVRSY